MNFGIDKPIVSYGAEALGIFPLGFTRSPYVCWMRNSKGSAV